MQDQAAEVSNSPLSTTASAEIDRLALNIFDRGLTTPAIFILEAHKPLANLIFTSTLLVEKLVEPLVGGKRWRTVRLLLETPEGVEQLIQNLEKLSNGCQVEHSTGEYQREFRSAE